MRACLVLLCALTIAAPIDAAAQTTPEADGIDQLLAQVQTVLATGTPDDFAALIDTQAPPEQVRQFTTEILQPGIVRAVVSERDRSQLENTAPGTAYRLVVEMFTETASRARIVTSLVDVRRGAGADRDAWRITGAQGLTTVEGLYRLRVNPDVRWAARGLTISATDLLITLDEGFVYQVDSDAGVTGLLLFGRGSMRFTPESLTEQGQVRIFAGSNTLDAEFSSAFVRMHPSQYEQRVSVDRLTSAPLDARQLRRAQDLFARDSPKSFSLDLSGLSAETWHLLPQPGDFLAEVQTRRHGVLTYSRSLAQVEDVTLFDRERERTIALYPSPERIAARGASYNEDDFRDYDVIDNDIEATISPQRSFIEGRARIRLRVRTPLLSSLTLRLADALTVSSVVSPTLGRLLHLRVRGQNSVIVNLPEPLDQGADVSLVVTYRGPVEPQEVEDEGVQTGDIGVGEPAMVAEPKLLLSNRSYWYPQNPVTDYATASLRITVPEGYGCVASGDLRPGEAVTLRDLLTLTDGKAFVFTAREPLRYFAVIVSRFIRVAESTIEIADRGQPTGLRPMRLTVEANPRQQAVGRALLGDFQAIMRYYASVLGNAPYASASIALVDHDLPGGHSPGFFAVLNGPLPGSPVTWRDDPAAFDGFPEFFLAHELAHQWWGQAVGWRNYHEQWLSEGFAQYFAALYAQQAHGERVFRDMVRQFSRWAVRESDEGPVSLGYRLGHIKAQPRVFRAVVYNKGAAVLHMLRQLVGDDVFFASLRRFYAEQTFQKASTDVLRTAFEAESGRPLGRFFERWIAGAEVPHIQYSRTIAADSVAIRFEQTTEQLFDVPVTVTLTHANGRTQDVIVPVTERVTEWSMPTTTAVRRLQVNRDSAAVARFDAR
jgi:hypothetical protein